MANRLAGIVAAAGVPGAVAMIADHGGVRFAEAAGVADPATGRVMALDTLFQIASMTKAMTSVAAMQLVERGRLALDAPLGDLLPDLADPMVIDGFDGDAARLRPAKRPITLRHLLTHTSGFGYDFASADLLRARGPAGPPTFGLKAALRAPLLFDPGDAWEYGMSTDWAGLAVEAASGQRLDAYLAEHVTGPLGMDDTLFHLDAGRAARLAPLQSRTPDGGFAPFPADIGGGPDAEFLSGGGGLKSSAPDYLRFLRMILGGGSFDGARILAPETVAEMSRNQIGGLRAGRMATTMPLFSHEIDVFPGMDSKWGLGFLINPEAGPHGRTAGSLAWAGIANSYYWVDPASGVCGLVMMQFLPFGDPAAQQVYADVERLAYA